MAFAIFSNTYPDYEGKLLKWKEQYPKHFAPHMALATYYQALAWESRGTRYAKDTSFEQFSGMEKNLTEAIQYIGLAIKYKPRLMPAYQSYISILDASSSASDEDENAMISRAFKLFPQSFLIKKQASFAKWPRWGGSYEQMEAIAREGVQYVDTNPNMALLYGMIYNDQAYYLTKLEKYEEAKSAYLKATNFGDYWYFYYKLASLQYYYLKDYEGALDSINQSIGLYTIDAESYLLKAKIQHILGNDTLAGITLDTARTIGGIDEDIEQWLQWVAKDISNKAHNIFPHDPQQAENLLNLALEYNPDSATVYAERARMKMLGGELEAGITDAQLAVQLDPDDIAVYKLLDLGLAREKRWQEIESLWDRFIERNPENAEAYFERAGTYHHMGKREEALGDLDKACSLGNDQACQRLKMEK
jgi:tetratricopeptide (TPR) repeat protein